MTVNQLKDFQTATVEYVFERFTDTANPCSRFLVADEVGLGKTLVARGVIAKFYEYLKNNDKSRFNVVYICSNQSIASQNISRLNVEKKNAFAPPKINRINDLAATQIHEFQNSYFSIVALSPHTSFNVTSGGGIVRERAILYHILTKHRVFSTYSSELRRVLRLDVNNENWHKCINHFESLVSEEISSKFNNTFTADNSPWTSLHSQLLTACQEKFNGKNLYPYRQIIGGLRKILASICVGYLKPDLVIMDEFQRFKSLIELDDDSEVKLITESLFTDETIKILLLSATPYKMYTLQSDEENGENHFEEFKFIVEFLLNDESKNQLFNQAWREYSHSLLLLDEPNWEFIKSKKKKVELLLKSVMARTERITVSDDKNTMLRLCGTSTLWISPAEINNFISADSVALKLKNAASPIEFCKSSPYPFSFMEGYQLHRLIQNEVEIGNREIKKALKKSKDSFLPFEEINDYKPIDLPNAKLDFLLNDILYNGGSDLLWIPPSLPYYQFAGAFKGKESFSKTLIFSSWIMVPKMIAALSSFECERLTIGSTESIKSTDERSERKYFQTGSERHPKPRLKFAIDDNKFNSLTNYTILYPCITLSAQWKPARQFQHLSEVIEQVTFKIEELIKGISISEYITEPQKKADDRWALIYMLLLDREFNHRNLSSIKSQEYGEYINWNWFDNDEETSVAARYYEKVFGEILFNDEPLQPILHELKLGHPPSDIAKLLAYLSVASPSICAYRLLNSYTSDEERYDYISFYGAFRIADSFRKFYNTPENIAVIDKYSLPDLAYWKNVIVYSAGGNLQSMLDEFASAMIDHNSLWDNSIGEKAGKLIEVLSDNIGLRTVSVTSHSYDSFIQKSKPKHLRCHFGVALNHSIDQERDVMRSDRVRNAFNSPFRPFILTTTSIGQEGLDFHLYCRKILHWNLPANPVDFEQREGRINRFKNLAIRQNLALKYRNKLDDFNSSNVWNQLYQLAIETEKGNKSDLVPYWHVEPQGIFIERQAPAIPYSKEVRKLKNLLKTISVYRIALGQPRQEELVNYLIENLSEDKIEKIQAELLINLSPYHNK